MDCVLRETILSCRNLCPTEVTLVCFRNDQSSASVPAKSPTETIIYNHGYNPCDPTLRLTENCQAPLLFSRSKCGFFGNDVVDHFTVRLGQVVWDSKKFIGICLLAYLCIKVFVNLLKQATMFWFVTGALDLILKAILGISTTFRRTPATTAAVVILLAISQPGHCQRAVQPNPEDIGYQFVTDHELDCHISKTAGHLKWPCMGGADVYYNNQVRKKRQAPPPTTVATSNAPPPLFTLLDKSPMYSCPPTTASTAATGCVQQNYLTDRSMCDSGSRIASFAVSVDEKGRSKATPNPTGVGIGKVTNPIFQNFTDNCDTYIILEHHVAQLPVCDATHPDLTINFRYDTSGGTYLDTTRLINFRHSVITFRNSGNAQQSSIVTASAQPCPVIQLREGKSLSTSYECVNGMVTDLQAVLEFPRSNMVNEKEWCPLSPLQTPNTVLFYITFGDEPMRYHGMAAGSESSLGLYFQDYYSIYNSINIKYYLNTSDVHHGYLAMESGNILCNRAESFLKYLTSQLPEDAIYRLYIEPQRTEQYYVQRQVNKNSKASYDFENSNVTEICKGRVLIKYASDIIITSHAGVTRFKYGTPYTSADQQCDGTDVPSSTNAIEFFNLCFTDTQVGFCQQMKPFSRELGQGVFNEPGQLMLCQTLTTDCETSYSDRTSEGGCHLAYACNIGPAYHCHDVCTTSACVMTGKWVIFGYVILAIVVAIILIDIIYNLIIWILRHDVGRWLRRWIWFMDNYCTFCNCDFRTQDEMIYHRQFCFHRYNFGLQYVNKAWDTVLLHGRIENGQVVLDGQYDVVGVLDWTPLSMTSIHGGYWRYIGSCSARIVRQYYPAYPLRWLIQLWLCIWSILWTIFARCFYKMPEIPVMKIANEKEMPEGRYNNAKVQFSKKKGSTRLTKFTTHLALVTLICALTLLQPCRGQQFLGSMLDNDRRFNDIPLNQNQNQNPAQPATANTDDGKSPSSVTIPNTDGFTYSPVQVSINDCTGTETLDCKGSILTFLNLGQPNDYRTFDLVTNNNGKLSFGLVVRNVSVLYTLSDGYCSPSYTGDVYGHKFCRHSREGHNNWADTYQDDDCGPLERNIGVSIASCPHEERNYPKYQQSWGCGCQLIGSGLGALFLTDLWERQGVAAFRRYWVPVFNATTPCVYKISHKKITGNICLIDAKGKELNCQPIGENNIRIKNEVLDITVTLQQVGELDHINIQKIGILFDPNVSDNSTSIKTTTVFDASSWPNSGQPAQQGSPGDYQMLAFSEASKSFCSEKTAFFPTVPLTCANAFNGKCWHGELNNNCLVKNPDGAECNLLDKPSGTTLAHQDPKTWLKAPECLMWVDKIEHISIDRGDWFPVPTVRSVSCSTTPTATTITVNRARIYATAQQLNVAITKIDQCQGNTADNVMITCPMTISNRHSSETSFHVYSKGMYVTAATITYTVPAGQSVVNAFVEVAANNISEIELCIQETGQCMKSKQTVSSNLRGRTGYQTFNPYWIAEAHGDWMAWAYNNSSHWPWWYWLLITLGVLLGIFIIGAFIQYLLRRHMRHLVYDEVVSSSTGRNHIYRANNKEE